MTKEERGRLLRARFRALGGHPMKLAPMPPKANTRPLKPKQPGRRGPFYGVALADVRPKWVGVPDAPRKRPLGERRRKGTPEVIRLMGAAPEKLVRKDFS